MNIAAGTANAAIMTQGDENMRTDCLSVPEIDAFINIDIPDMLQRDDIAVYRQIGERHVTATSRMSSDGSGLSLRKMKTESSRLHR